MDLAVLEQNGLFNGAHFSTLKEKNVFNQASLNAFISLGKEFWHEARTTIQSLFSKGNEGKVAGIPFSHKASESKMKLPIQIGDYTDFYSSRNHAYNVGVMVRGPDNALQPNWTHLPVGYHGRSSSVIVSGTDVIRPKG